MKERGSAELLWQTQDVEYFVGKQLGTLRNIDMLYYFLNFDSPKDLIDQLSGKNVVDIGSGLNGLAIDVILKKLPIEVTSINPACKNMNFEPVQIDKLVQDGDILFPNNSPEVIESARKEANKKTYPYFAHDLKIPDGTFDIAIDHAAVFLYSDYNRPLVFAQSVSEMIRVCKKGSGRILVGDFGTIYGGKNPDWKEQILNRMNVNYAPRKHGLEIFT